MIKSKSKSKIEKHSSSPIFSDERLRKCRGYRLTKEDIKKEKMKWMNLI
jgi:hypothetical protein